MGRPNNPTNFKTQAHQRPTLHPALRPYPAREGYDFLPKAHAPAHPPAIRERQPLLKETVLRQGHGRRISAFRGQSRFYELYWFLIVSPSQHLLYVTVNAARLLMT